MTDLAISAMKMKSSRLAHEVVGAVYCWTLHGEVARTETILTPLIHYLLCDFEYF